MIGILHGISRSLGTASGLFGQSILDSVVCLSVERSVTRKPILSDTRPWRTAFDTIVITYSTLDNHRPDALHNNNNNDNNDNDNNNKMIEGCIVRKKKRADHVVLTLRLLPPDPNHKVLIPKDNQDVLAFCFVGSTIRVHGTLQETTNNNNKTNEEEEEDEDKALVPLTVWLVRCAPDPHAVVWAMKAILDGRVSLDVLAGSVTSLDELQSLHQQHHAKPRVRRLAVGRIVACLRGGERETMKPPRQRPPHIKRAERNLLDRIEQEQESILKIPHQRLFSTHTDTATATTAATLPLNHAVNEQSCRGPRSRNEYLHGKKEPQIRWMTERIRLWCGAFRHVVDVGGGRGDLAVALAVSFPGIHVTMVEKNRTSLVAAQQHAQKALGHHNHQHKSTSTTTVMRFVQADFAVFAQDPHVHLSCTTTTTTIVSGDSTTTTTTNNNNTIAAPPKIDLVVALHACGDLSDMALEFAQKQQCPFVVCPCCFTKHLIPTLLPRWYQCLPTNELEVVQRLAESENRPLSQRAMTIINSLRLDHVQRTHYYKTLAIEEYSSECSLRNYVLIGETLATSTASSSLSSASS